MHNRVLLVLVCFILTCALASCSTVPTRHSDKGERGETENITCPLTGLECQAVNNPTTMVMINNVRSARPQTGLNRADVVVEMLAEGEITRYAAFYQSDMTGTVGPVRSVRDYFYELAKGAKAELVSAGGSKGSLAMIKRDAYPHIDGVHGDGNYFTRVNFRKAPHNLYTNFDQLKQAMKDKGFNHVSPAKYSFSTKPSTIDGNRAHTVHMTYHRLYEGGYQYDEKSGNYIRYTEGKQQIDRETLEPLTMQNVMVVFAKHRLASALGHRSIGITDSGKGYLVQKGTVIPIEWRFREGLVVPFSQDKELTLLPGKTWVNVLPETGKVEFR